MLIESLITTEKILEVLWTNSNSIVFDYKFKLDVFHLIFLKRQIVLVYLIEVIVAVWLSAWMIFRFLAILFLQDVQVQFYSAPSFCKIDAVTYEVEKNLVDASWITPYSL